MSRQSESNEGSYVIVTKVKGWGNDIDVASSKREALRIARDNVWAEMAEWVNVYDASGRLIALYGWSPARKGARWTGGLVAQERRDPHRARE